MKEAFGLWGLALVLLAVLIFAPMVKPYSEGFNAEVVEKVEETKDIKDKVMSLMKEVKAIEDMVESPGLEKATKEKMLTEIQDRRTQIAKLTGQEVASDPTAIAAVKAEGFEGIYSADLEKTSKASDFLQKATQSSFEDFLPVQ